ncbi:hypothetical protein [Glycomyces arizonensis]|uniref:hypothetical protein n=1 Tax=Glycomyces arizonensis TaxID=256035 RepID=UPI0004200A34|nr:hypothetical protein [Glycomyces arizonensis]
MPSEVTITMTAADGQSMSRLDRWCQEIETDLRSVRGVSVEPAAAEAAPGTKSGAAQQIGTLIVSGLLSAAALKSIADVVIAALQRSSAGSVTVKRGDREVVMEGLPPKDVKRAAAEILKVLEEDA